MVDTDGRLDRRRHQPGLLRAEKGYIIVGQETDGTVTPDDVGLAGMIAKAKEDFVGKRSLGPMSSPRAASSSSASSPRMGRSSSTKALRSLPTRTGRIPMTMLGDVTSNDWIPNCRRSIAMALVADGRALQGRTLHVTTPEGFTRVTVVDPVFLDLKGERINA